MNEDTRCDDKIKGSEQVRLQLYHCLYGVQETAILGAI